MHCYCVGGWWVRCLVSKFAQARLISEGRKVVGPRDSFVLKLQGGPQETDTQWHRCPQRGEIGSKHRWTLDGHRECPREDGRAGPRCPSTGGPWGHREEGGNEQI